MSKLQKTEKDKAQNKKDLLLALERNLGIITPAIKATGLSRQTHYNYMAEDEEYAKAVARIKEEQKDFVESKMLQAIKADNVTLMIFYAKTQMKDRGYVERTELTGAEGKDLLAGYSNEELEAEIERLRTISNT